MVDDCRPVNNENSSHMSAGERLKEERVRLKMPQWLLGQHGGVSKDTQINYEKGERKPDLDYLAGVAAVGVDVLYVVTGKRTPVRQHVITVVQHDDEEVSGRPVIPLDEKGQAMVRNYAAAGEEGRRTIERVALLAAESESRAPKRAKSSKSA